MFLILECNGKVHYAEYRLHNKGDKNHLYHMILQAPYRFKETLYKSCCIERLIIGFVKVVNELQEIIVVCTVTLLLEEPVGSNHIHFYLNNVLFRWSCEKSPNSIFYSLLFFLFIKFLSTSFFIDQRCILQQNFCLPL